MANTYTLIASNVLSSNTLNFTFTSIPSTYTDLVLRASVRKNQTTNFSEFYIKPNSDSGTNYSFTMLYGTGTVATTSNAAANGNGLTIRYIDANSDTTNTFSSSEIYIPNYNSTSTKQISSFSVEEHNGTNAGLAVQAHYYQGTSAITSLLIGVPSLTLLSGSSFYLYGIKNS
jgi:hypothetical protein